ncbi:MAG: hypothetical protein WBN44_16555, partial [Woeseiaceae bacterium]
SSAFVAVCFAVLLPAAVNSEEGAASVWHCESGQFERELALFRGSPADPAGPVAPVGILACKVVYTKNGNSEVLWQARNDPDFCKPRVLALIEKLRNAGFTCEQEAQSTDATPVEPVVTAEVVAAPDAENFSADAASTESVSNEASEAIRRLLESHYEDSYLDAMVVAIPSGFSPLPGTAALSAGSGGVLHVGPPDHFVKTQPDGSYVLVNTLRLEQGAATSFVNLGFLVRDKRYRFLGYAAAHSVSSAVVQEAGTEEVSLMVSEVSPPSCVVSRRPLLLRWAPLLDIPEVEPSRAPRDPAGCND